MIKRSLIEIESMQRVKGNPPVHSLTRSQTRFTRCLSRNSIYEKLNGKVYAPCKMNTMRD